jgi:hypothetical protein
MALTSLLASDKWSLGADKYPDAVVLISNPSAWEAEGKVRGPLGLYIPVSNTKITFSVSGYLDSRRP